MTRELKFRVWFEPTDKYKKEEAELGRQMPEDIYAVFYCSDALFDDTWINLNDYKSEPIIEQYTGLKDKNGQLIYEGDIIDYNSDGQAIGYVKYNAPHYELIDKEGYTMFLKGSPHQTIIGNIHENPELLKEYI